MEFYLGTVSQMCLKNISDKFPLSQWKVWFSLFIQLNTCKHKQKQFYPLNANSLTFIKYKQGTNTPSVSLFEAFESNWHFICNHYQSIKQ